MTSEHLEVAQTRAWRDKFHPVYGTHVHQMWNYIKNNDGNAFALDHLLEQEFDNDEHPDDQLYQLDVQRIIDDVVTAQHKLDNLVGLENSNVLNVFAISNSPGLHNALKRELARQAPAMTQRLMRHEKIGLRKEMKNTYDTVAIKRTLITTISSVVSSFDFNEAFKEDIKDYAAIQCLLMKRYGFEKKSAISAYPHLKIFIDELALGLEERFPFIYMEMEISLFRRSLCSESMAISRREADWNKENFKMFSYDEHSRLFMSSLRDIASQQSTDWAMAYHPRTGTKKESLYKDCYEELCKNMDWPDFSQPDVQQDGNGGGFHLLETESDLLTLSLQDEAWEIEMTTAARNTPSTSEASYLSWQEP
jgi:hypothetical protein